jgi:hypothetical protein
MPNMEEDHAVALDMPNNQYPYPKPVIYYGNQSVPSPSNNAAKAVDAARVMREVNHAK